MNKNTKITGMSEFAVDIDLMQKNALDHIKSIESAKEISRNEESGRRLMRDKSGGMFMTTIDLPTYNENLYGYAVKCEGEVNDETIEEAKSIVVDKMCEIIREIAKRFPSKFFVIKRPDDYNKGTKTINLETDEVTYVKYDDEIVDFSTVGCKLLLPFAIEDEK
jgi:hypothetical protein